MVMPLCRCPIHNGSILAGYVKVDDGGAANVSASIECFVAGPNEVLTLAHLNTIMKRRMNAMRAGVQTLVKTAQDDESV